MPQNWRRPRTSQQNCYLERRRRWLHQMSLTERRLLTDRLLLIDRQLLIDGRRRQPLPSSDRREFKSPSARSRSQMRSPANPSRPRIRRPASWKSSMHFAGHSVCQLAATASRTGQVNPRRTSGSLPFWCCHRVTPTCLTASSFRRKCACPRKRVLIGQRSQSFA